MILDDPRPVRRAFVASWPMDALVCSWAIGIQPHESTLGSLRHRTRRPDRHDRRLMDDANLVDHLARISSRNGQRRSKSAKRMCRTTWQRNARRASVALACHRQDAPRTASKRESDGAGQAPGWMARS